MNRIHYPIMRGLVAPSTGSQHGCDKVYREGYWGHLTPPAAYSVTTSPRDTENERRRAFQERGFHDLRGKGDRRILVVDDEAFVRTLPTDILEEEGYLVETADNGDVGIRLLEKR